ncbi:MAG: hypothetical protein M3238_02470 [Actinomycetota bacterium]|nr:hypothetical protein [Actinomycetota bacterium]
MSATFGWAAVLKVARFGSWRAALVRYRLPATVFSVALVAVPLFEASAVALLLFGSTPVGAALSLALLSTFSWAVVRARAISGDRVPCGCFGRLEERDYRTMLLRNAALGLAAAAVLIRGGDSNALSGFALPRADEAVPALLVVVGVALIAWLGWQAAATARGQRR